MNLEEVKKLTDDELNKKIAIFDGWEYVPEKIGDDQWALFRDGHWKGGEQDIPDYCNDLNAIYKVVLGLTENQQQMKYNQYMYDVVGGKNITLIQWGWAFLMATARQRAEAFILTMENNEKTK